MKRARLHPEAEAEVRDAAAWYKESSPEVARRFVREIRMLIRTITRKPLRFPVLAQPNVSVPVRRALVSGFPYAVVFLVTEDATHVLAVAHQKRMPGYWLHRLQP